MHYDVKNKVENKVKIKLNESQEIIVNAMRDNPNVKTAKLMAVNRLI